MMIIFSILLTPALPRMYLLTPAAFIP